MNENGNASIFTLLGILFIGLKLMGYITWSWFWVLSPFWFAFLVLVAIVALGVYCSK